jgi:uncharacterized repeat protein (TIGR04042 family)
MPEMRFQVQWPDQTISDCYSPSLVIKDFFNVGQRYEIADFVNRSREALNIASERVKQKYGFYCTSAMAQLAEIEQRAAHFDHVAQAMVTIVKFQE